MQNINRCAFGLVVQICRCHQMQTPAVTKAFGRLCRQRIKLLLDTDHGRRAVRQAVSFRYRLPFAADAARLCSLLQPVHDKLRQRKQLAVPAVSLPVCRQHHLYLARAAHQFPDDRHRLWCEAVKAVYPDVIVPNQLRLRDLCQKQVDIVLGVGVFARDPAFIFLIQQGQICQLFGRVRPLRQFAGNHCKLRTAAVKLLELRDEIVYHFDKGILALQTAEYLQMFPLGACNIRQEHMPSVLVDEAALAAAELSQQAVAQPRQRKHLNIHQSFLAGTRKQCAFHLQCKLVGHK